MKSLRCDKILRPFIWAIYVEVMKTLQKIKVLIRLLTRAHSYDIAKAELLREVPIARSFTPNSVIVNPFKDLPNVRTLTLQTNVCDPLLINHGVEKKLTPEMVFEVLCWRTKAANRYTRIMHGRLSNLLIKGHLNGYWCLALMLMRKSKVLRALALRKFELNWHRKYSLALIKKILNQLDDKILELPTELSIKRGYVDKPKPDGTKTFRPIGSPSYADRMFLYLWQCFIVMFLCKYISPNQHAYRPGSGVTSALAGLKKLLIDLDYKYVWEFDLKGAFPSVYVPEVMKSLREVGMPYEIVDWLEESSLATVEEVDLKRARDKGLALHGKPFPEPKFVRQNNIRSGPLPRFAKIGREIELNTFSRSRAELGYLPIEYRGFPQGSGISPVLFNFCFEVACLRGHFLKINPDCIVLSYADDFLVFSKEDMPNIFERSPAMIAHGLEFNLEKSRILKIDGVWTVPKFKFLGTTFNTLGELITVTGSPRSGKILDFDKPVMVAKFLARDSQLEQIGRSLPEGKLMPDNILAAWGQGLEPFDKLPLEFMNGTRLLTDAEMKEFISDPRTQEVGNELSKKWGENIEFQGNDASSEALGNANIPLSVKTLIEEFSIDRELGDEEIDTRVRENDLSSSNELAFLDSRLNGLIMNRLFTGTWEANSEVVNKSLDSFPGSWLNLKWNTVLFYREGYSAPSSRRLSLTHAQSETIGFIERELSIYNSTSLATKDLLKGLRNKSTLKIKNRMLPRSV